MKRKNGQIVKAVRNIIILELEFLIRKSLREVEGMRFLKQIQSNIIVMLEVALDQVSTRRVRISGEKTGACSLHTQK